MQRDTDRDRAIEHLLRQTSTAAAADERACIDGEALAAWTEGQLRGAEADVVEQHLSTCARCQQLLAAFARTTPAPPVPVPLWRRWRLRWLVPVATAATVAALWVAMPRETREERSAYVAAPTASQARRLPESAPVPPIASEPAPANGAPRQERDRSSARKNQADVPDRKALEAAASPPATREELERRLDDSNAVGELQKAQPTSAATADTGAPARGAASVAGVARDAASARAQAETTQSTAPSPPANAPQAAPRAAGEQPPAPARERGAPTAFETATFRQAVAMVEIVSPNPSNRWRISGAQLERTTNGGAQWAAVALPSEALLTAGSSPGPSICWIVGRGGAVYLTIDGSTFARIPFPQPIDLITVTATDDRRAAVTSSDGRTFSTADRGRSWSSVPR